MSDNYQSKTAKGVSWGFIDNLLSSGISFLIGLLLARILSPEEFGVVGITMIFVAVSNAIADGGFSNALTRKLQVDDRDYQTVFTLNFTASLLLYLVLFASSPLLAFLFRDKQLEDVIKVISLVIVFNGFSIVHRTMLIREVNFKTQAKISIVSSLSSAVVGVGLAYSGYGIWALVAQQLIRNGLNSILLWTTRRWIPHFTFSYSRFKELFGYGSKILLSSLIDTIYNNIYYMVIAGLYSSRMLGLYSRAEQFTSVFAVNFATVLQKVSLPVLSRFQNDEERLKAGYNKLLKNAMIITAVALAGFGAMAKSIVVIVIGAKWLPCVPFLQILCLAALFQPMNMINQNVLQVRGLSGLFLKLEMIKKAIAVAIIGLGIYIGIYGLLWGSVAISFLSFFINSFYAKRYINYSSWQQLRDVYPYILTYALIGMSVYLIEFLHFTVLWTALFQLLVWMVLSIVTLLFLFKDRYIDLSQVVKSLLLRKK